MGAAAPTGTGARHPELGDGYQAALINFGYLANAVLSTDEVVKAMGQRAGVEVDGHTLGSKTGLYPGHVMGESPGALAK